MSRYELDDWCVNHECGHNNQGAINLEGGTEVSNNLFSNVVRFLDGLVTSVGNPLSIVMDEYAQHTPFFVRPVDSQLRMYYQLYLYYHQARKNTSFYPNLFKALRDDPLTLWTNNNNSALKFVRKVCEVAGEDLTDFFTAWGFFEPFSDMSIEDYGQHTMTVTQADINSTLAEIDQYPDNNTILFIEDRADYVPTTDFLTTAGNHRRDSEKVGQCGELGQFTDYSAATSQSGNYTFLQADSLYAMSGTGGIGFLILDENGKFVYAANSLNFCIPSSIEGNFTVYTIAADGTLQEAPKVGSGAETVWINTAGTLSDSLSTQVIKATIGGNLNGKDFKYLRELAADNNLVSINLTNATIKSGGGSYDGQHSINNNTIGEKLFYQYTNLANIRLPESITSIGNNAFTETGLKEACIPDNVTSVGGDAFAYCKQLTSVVVGSKVSTMGQGVFYSSNVKDAYVKALTPPTISAYLFSSKPVIHVYHSAEAAYKASAWAEFGTIVGDLDDYEQYAFPSIEFSDEADNTKAIAAANGKTYNVKINGRTLYRDGDWNTLTLPFNVTLDGSPLAGATARPLTSATLSGSTLTLHFGNPVTQLEAGTPYIIKWASDKDITSPVFKGVTVSTQTHNYAGSHISFTGNYAPAAIAANDKNTLYLGANNTLYYPNIANFKVNAFRAYFHIANGSQAKGFVLSFDDDEPTGLQECESSEVQESGSWFTLDGRRLNGKPTAKGVYINNRHKVRIY